MKRTIVRIAMVGEGSRYIGCVIFRTRSETICATGVLAKDTVLKETHETWFRKCCPQPERKKIIRKTNTEAILVERRYFGAENLYFQPKTIDYRRNFVTDNNSYPLYIALQHEAVLLSTPRQWSLCAQLTCSDS